MKEARELLKIAKGLVYGLDDVLKYIKKTLGDLEELSDNIEDSVETFSQHFKFAAVDTEVDGQFDLLKKAISGLKAAVEAKRQLEGVARNFPEDKTVQRALRDADVMIKRFERHQADARKVIKTLSKKTMPDGLKKYAQSVARIVKGKFKNPKDLLVIPWQTKTYDGAVIYQVLLRVENVGDLGMNGRLELTLGEYTGSREPAGVMGWGVKIEQMSPKEAAQRLLEPLRGWPGLKGAEEAGEKRMEIAQAIASAMNRAMNSMSKNDMEKAEIERGGTEISGSYRANSLPKEGESAVGEYAYRDMTDDEKARIKKAFEPLVKQYQKYIKNIWYSTGEKSWVYIHVELK